MGQDNVIDADEFIEIIEDINEDISEKEYSLAEFKVRKIIAKFDDILYKLKKIKLAKK